MRWPIESDRIHLRNVEILVGRTQIPTMLAAYELEYVEKLRLFCIAGYSCTDKVEHRDHALEKWRSEVTQSDWLIAVWFAAIISVPKNQQQTIPR